MNPTTITFDQARCELFPAMREFLLESENLYPGIDRWWQKKVLPGLRDGSRICRVALKGETIAALSIGKLSSQTSKFCTFRVRDEFQGNGIGRRLINETLVELLGTGCNRIHYTMAESVVTDCHDFFRPYGFGVESWETDEYVRGMDEFHFEACASHVRSELQRQRLNPLTGDVAVLSVHPEYARMIESGEKMVEFRKSFARRFTTGRILFYVTSPVKEFRFMAALASVVKSTPRELWEQFGPVAGVNKKTFFDYYRGAKQGVALVLGCVTPLKRAVPLDEARAVNARYRPPMSYTLLRSDDPVVQLASAG